MSGSVAVPAVTRIDTGQLAAKKKPMFRFVRGSVCPAVPYFGDTARETGRGVAPVVYRQGKRKDYPPGETSVSSAFKNTFQE
jgi:hypothetical protein